MGFLLLLKSIPDLMGGKGVFGRGEEGGRELFFIICGPHINLPYVATGGENLTMWRPHKRSNGQAPLTVQAGSF